MMATTHPLADDYLKRLERAARPLPRRDRDALLADIRGHFDAGLTPNSTEADVRNLLEKLGSPEDVAAAAAPVRPATRRGARETFALVLLVTGLPPVVGWLLGVGLLLWSPLWSAREKLLGILVWPGGYVALLGLGVVAERSCGAAGRPVEVSTDCVSAAPSVWSVVGLVVLAVAPLVVAGYLYRAAGRTDT
jgi:hypothetical protein